MYHERFTQTRGSPLRRPQRYARVSWHSAFSLGVLASVALSGCAGGGRVEIASLNFEAIDPPGAPPPRFTNITLDRCYWWLDDHGRVCVAMERHAPAPLGPAWQFRFQMVLQLGEMPAGHARDYRVTKRELRAVARFGPSRSRFTSISGVVALYRRPSDRLRGSFRLLVAREVQQMLGGWGLPGRYLMMGTFEAVPDQERGRQIVADIDSLTAPPDDQCAGPPTSAPSSAPSSAPGAEKRADRAAPTAVPAAHRLERVSGSSLNTHRGP